MHKVWIIMTAINGYKNVYNGAVKGYADFYDNEEDANALVEKVKALGWYDEVWAVPMWGCSRI